MPKIHFFILILCMITFSSYAMKDEESINDYKLFKTVQKIRRITSKTRERFEEYDVHIDGGSPTPDPNYYQTSQGLLLLASIYPDCLATPWGKVELTDKECICSQIKLLAFYQTLLKKFRARLAGVMELKPKDTVKIYTLKHNSINLEKLLYKEQITEPDFNFLFKEISKGQLSKEMGKKALIVLSPAFDNTITYKIELAKNPEPEFLPAQARRGHNETISSWNALQKRYNQDN